MAQSIDGRRELLVRHCLTEDEFKKSGLQWDALDRIRDSHVTETADLRDSVEYVYKRLLSVPDVHSLKVRVKDPDHLVAKIIRKKIDDPSLEIDPDNYRDYITDLIGIRALHLFKDQWQPIHNFIIETWGLDLLHETPLAYIRKGDAGAVIDAQKAAGCRVQEHPYGYRSVHYLIRSQPARKTRITELQVRTVFEEGWSEIDHQVRYPRVSGDPLLSELTVVFNRLAGSADEMGSFIKILSQHLRDQTVRQGEEQERLALAEEKVNKLIQQSKASEKEKEELQRQVKNLREQLPVPTGWMNSESNGVLIGLGAVGSGLLDVGRINSLTGLGDAFRTSSGVLGTYFPGSHQCPECGAFFGDNRIWSSAVPADRRCPSCRAKSG